MATCDICYSLDAEKHFYLREHLRRLTRATKLCRVGDISASAEKGCRGCSLLTEGISASAAHLQGTDSVHILFVSGLPLRVEASGVDLEFYVSDAPLPTPNIGQARRISASLDAELAGGFAREWLRRCGSEHVVCNESLSKGRILRPRRLLDVGSGDGSEDPRLVEAGDVGGPYVALSYCWGTDGCLTTTKSTIKERFAGIQYEQLPKTYQDAVDVTRSIRVRYLWIDALCIIQDDDDDEDWKIECQKMGSVYQGAFLTLSATCSSSATQGFLGPRSFNGRRGSPLARAEDPMPQCVYKVSWVSFEGKTRDVFVRRRLVHSVIVPEDADPTGCPLLTRGWAFQERLLATRTLHFLPQELLWECKCEYWCECMGVAADQIWKTGGMKGSWYNKAMSDPQKMNPTTVWQTLITDYSRRLLTKKGDKLPALHGVALQFQNSNLGMGRYLAGLWERDLLRHLIWQSIPHHQRFQEKHPPRKLASWSWIASSVPVQWPSLHHENLESDTQVLEAYCTRDDSGQLGQAESGRVILSAPFMIIPLGDPLDGARGTFHMNVEGAGATKLDFIPDATTAALQLRADVPLFCAMIFTYMKEDACRWVALALRPVMDTNVRGAVVDVYRNRPRPPPDAIASEYLYRSEVLENTKWNAIDSMGHVYHDWVGDLQKRNELKSIADWYDSDLRPVMEVTERALESTELKGQNRPVYRSMSGLGSDDEDQAFVRVGIVQGMVSREDRYWRKDWKMWRGLRRRGFIVE